MRCPSCQQDTLGLYLDPSHADSGPWHYCHNCSLHGDSIELYSSVHRLGSAEAGITQALAKREFRLPAYEFTPPGIKMYLENYPIHRAKMDLVWKYARDGLGQNMHPDVLHRMQKLHLWGSWRYGAAQLNSFLGGTTRQEMNRLFDTEVLPREGFHASLVLNYQDLPGRTSAFEFLGQEENLFKFTNTTSNPKQEGGLLWLDLLKPGEEVVYALPDPILGLHLQRRHLIDSNLPLKLVVYNEFSSAVWNSISADRVIFWAPFLDWRVFAQARSCQNSYLANAPKLKDISADNLQKVLAKDSSNELLAQMRESAKPWPEFFAQWAADPGLPEHELRAVVQKLSLSVQERDTIVALCPRDRRPRLEHLLANTGCTVKEIHIQSHTVEEREDGWYLKRANGADELILSTPVKLFREIVDLRTNRTYWHGGLRIQGQLVEFVTDTLIIQKNPFAWLCEITSRAGQGVPSMNPNWNKMFLYLVKSFNTPKVVKFSTDWGITTEGDVVFPLFRLVKGAIIPEDTYLDPHRTPGMGIHPPLTRVVSPADTQSPARTAVIAGFAAFVLNWLLRRQHLPACPVIYVGAQGSIAVAAVRHLAKVLDLQRHELSTDTARISSKLALLAEDVTFPLFIDPLTYSMARYIPTPLSTFAFTHADRNEAAVLAIGGNWIRIYTPSLRFEEQLLPPADDLVNYLIDLQRRQFNLPTTETLFESVLEDLAAWYHRYLSNTQEELLKNLHKICAPPATPAEALLETVWWLRQSGKLSTSTIPLEKLVKDGVVTEPRSGAWRTIVRSRKLNAIYVSRSCLMHTLKQEGLPIPDFGPVTLSLAQGHYLDSSLATPDGWLLKQNVFDSAIRKLTSTLAEAAALP